MEGKINYLENLKKEEEEIESQKKRIQEKRKFYEECHNFIGKDITAILGQIIPMISKVEGKVYVDHTFSFTEEDHYETEWRSPYEGQYGVSGAELRATSVPHSVKVKGEKFQTRLIVEKSICDMFEILEFTTCKDYKGNLSRLLATTKYFEIKDMVTASNKYLQVKNMGFKASMFSDMFPYVAEYLERLTEWRLENGTKEIPEEVLVRIAEEVTADTMGQAQKEPVKVIEKNDN